MNLEKISTLHPTMHNEQTLIIALNHGRVNEMGTQELKAWESLTGLLEQGTIRTLITTSYKKSKKGTPIFIAGANVTERKGWSDNDVRAHVRWQRNTLQNLRRVPIFHICVVPGIALGWGTEFLLTADYRITTPQGVFGLPETSLGIVPGAGGTSDLWQEIGIAHALRMGMTGERIDSKEACAIGLCQEELPSQQEAMDRALTLAKKIAQNSPTAVAAYKRALLASVGRGANLRQGLEAQAYEHCVHTGEASIGREHFGSTEPTPWGPFKPFSL